MDQLRSTLSRRDGRRVPDRCEQVEPRASQTLSPPSRLGGRAEQKRRRPQNVRLAASACETIPSPPDFPHMYFRKAKLRDDVAANRRITADPGAFLVSLFTA